MHARKLARCAASRPSSLKKHLSVEGAPTLFDCMEFDETLATIERLTISRF